MGKNRLEAFSDGVIAIIITIMVLELKVPHEAASPPCSRSGPVLLSYVLRLFFLGIYWNNHHHLLNAEAGHHRSRSLGELASAFLALADSLLHRLDGREPFRHGAISVVWCRSFHDRDRILDIATSDHCVAGSQLDSHIQIDTRKNEPVVTHDETLGQWHLDHGTRVELEIVANWQQGQRFVNRYVEHTALANPHATIHYTRPVPAGQRTTPGARGRGTRP